MKTPPNTSDIARSAALSAIAELEMKQGVKLLAAEVDQMEHHLTEVIQRAIWMTRWWKQETKGL